MRLTSLIIPRSYIARRHCTVVHPMSETEADAFLKLHRLKHARIIIDTTLDLLARVNQENSLHSTLFGSMRFGENSPIFDTLDMVDIRFLAADYRDKGWYTTAMWHPIHLRVLVLSNSRYRLAYQCIKVYTAWIIQLVIWVLIGTAEYWLPLLAWLIVIGIGIVAVLFFIGLVAALA